MKAFLVSVLSLVLLGFFSLPAKATGITGERGWLLIQRSKVVGDSQVYITSKAMRIDNKNMGFSVIALPSQNRIIVFNDDNKTFCYQTPEQWKVFFANRVAGLHGKDLDNGNGSWVKGRVQPIAGLQSTQYYMKRVDTEKKFDKAMEKGRMVAVVRAAECWVSGELPSSDTSLKLMCRLYGIPVINGVPLRASFQDDTKPPMAVLDTLKASRVDIPASKFALPKGYKQVKSGLEVVMGTEGQEMMESIAAGLGELFMDDDDKAKPSSKGVPGKKP